MFTGRDLTDERFGRLICLERIEDIIKKSGRAYQAWNCRCDCGNEKIILREYLINGETQSCGCLIKEGRINPKRLEKLQAGKRKFEPHISSARDIWRACKQRKKCYLSFEEFYNISQQNCHYCGIAPSNRFNKFTHSSRKNSQYGKDNGLFIYNGLDRIDSNQDYTINNVVACCLTCNMAKTDSSVEEFLSRIARMNVPNFQTIDIQPITLEGPGAWKTSIKSVFKGYAGYNDGDLKLEEFYYLSQLPCFYCGVEKLNTVNPGLYNKNSFEKYKQEGYFYYNGLDRIDSNLPHNKDNVVPCCIYCNFAKGKLFLDKFDEWIKRIQKYQKQKAVRTHRLSEFFS